MIYGEITTPVRRETCKECAFVENGMCTMPKLYKRKVFERQHRERKYNCWWLKACDYKTTDPAQKDRKRALFYKAVEKRKKAYERAGEFRHHHLFIKYGEKALDKLLGVK